MDRKEWQVLSLRALDESHPLLTSISEDLVGRRSHHLDQLILAREIDRFRSGMRFGVAGAVPIEISPALSPCHTAILSDDGDKEFGIPHCAPLIGAMERQLPTDVRFGLVEVGPFTESEMVKGTAHPTIEAGAVEEDARSIDPFRLSIVIKADLSDAQLPTTITTRVHLPDIGSEARCC
jgi:hypothetical protein